MAVKTEAAPYLEAFSPNAGEPGWLREARRDAGEVFGARGFPTRRDEPWRFTNLKPLTENFFPLPSLKSESTAGLDVGLRRYGVEEIKDAYRLFLVNGVVRSVPTDLPQGVWVDSMARAIAGRPELAERAITETDLAGGQPFASLNAALFADGFAVEINDGVVLDRPIEIIHVGDGAVPVSLHPRNIILIAPDSTATVIERYVGNGRYWTNSVTMVDVLDGAVLNHIQVQHESRDALHFDVVRAELAGDARYRNVSLTLGAGLSRHDVWVRLGKDSAVDVTGAYLQRGDQDTTNAVIVDHTAPGATTRELFKGVLDERSHGAFLGTIRVREGAQKTDAKQTSRTLLLSDRASVDTKPELEILADDVKCAHGAAVGDLDKDTLFYLRARGIGIDEARRMLIEAFVLGALETIEQPALREYLARDVRGWLEAA